MIFTEIADKLERAARNGTRAHLDADLVRALVASPAYGVLQGCKMKELASQWQVDNAADLPGPLGSSSGTTGSNTDPSETTGRSVGTMQPHVHVAAEALASAAVKGLTRRKPRVKRSPATT